MNSLRWFFLLSLFITGCISGPKRLAEIEKNLTEIQSATPEQGRAVLEPLCEKGARGACALLGKPADPRHIVPVLQSVTSENQSRFVAVVPKSETVLYFVRKPNGALVRLQPDHFIRPHSRSAVDQVEVFELNPKDGYELFLIGSDGDLWDRRRFRTLDLKRKRARVAVISCMDDHLKDMADKMWPQVLGQKPDLMFLIGDNVYADHVGGGWQVPNPDTLWDRYVETFQDLPLYRTPELIPVLATWDDHDYGRNDSDRTYAYKDQSLEVFFTFFAQRRPAPGLERGPGVSSWWSAYGVQFGLLDDRYFRSPDKLDIPDQTHFGPDQEKWIADHLRAARQPVFLISGDQFFGAYHKFESYEGSHPKSFQAQLAEWRKSKVPVVFVSGDRHLTEVIKVPAQALGYPTFEITSSGIHSTVFANAFKDSPSPNQMVGMAGVYNYSILELMRSERSLIQFAVQAFGPDQKLLYQKTLTVKHP